MLEPFYPKLKIEIPHWNLKAIYKNVGYHPTEIRILFLVLIHTITCTETKKIKNLGYVTLVLLHFSIFLVAF